MNVPVSDYSNFTILRVSKVRDCKSYQNSKVKRDTAKPFKKSGDKEPGFRDAIGGWFHGLGEKIGLGKPHGPQEAPAPEKLSLQPRKNTWSSSSTTTVRKSINYSKQFDHIVDFNFENGEERFTGTLETEAPRKRRVNTYKPAKPDIALINDNQKRLFKLGDHDRHSIMICQDQKSIKMDNIQTTTPINPSRTQTDPSPNPKAPRKLSLNVQFDTPQRNSRDLGSSPNPNPNPTPPTKIGHIHKVNLNKLLQCLCIDSNLKSFMYSSFSFSNFQQQDDFIQNFGTDILLQIYKHMSQMVLKDLKKHLTPFSEPTKTLHQDSILSSLKDYLTSLLSIKLKSFQPSNLDLQFLRKNAYTTLKNDLRPDLANINPDTVEYLKKIGNTLFRLEFN